MLKAMRKDEITMARVSFRNVDFWTCGRPPLTGLVKVCTSHSELTGQAHIFTAASRIGESTLAAQVRAYR